MSNAQFAALIGMLCFLTRQVSRSEYAKGAYLLAGFAWWGIAGVAFFAGF